MKIFKLTKNDKNGCPTGVKVYESKTKLLKDMANLLDWFEDDEFYITCEKGENNE